MAELNGGGNGSVVSAWKWISASLLTIVMFLTGFLLGGYTVYARMEVHTNLPGHPVMEQRLTDWQSSTEKALDEIKQAQRDQNIILDDIYRNLPQ